MLTRRKMLATSAAGLAAPLAAGITIGLLPDYTCNAQTTQA
jgi:hypothetical protein